MCTIHQPSSQIFAMFHKVLLLADGRINFIGSPQEAVSFFSLYVNKRTILQSISIYFFLLFPKLNISFDFRNRNGYDCPPAYNPADFLIGVLSKTDPGEEPNNVAHQLCDAFETSRRQSGDDDADEMIQSPPTNGFATNGGEELKRYETVQKPLWIFTVYWLIYRNLLIVARDPSIQKIRILQKIVSVKFCSRGFKILN